MQAMSISTRDTVFDNYRGSLQVFDAIRGNTVSGLGAVGSDIMIYKGFFGFVEIRASGSLDSRIYDIIWM